MGVHELWGVLEPVRESVPVYSLSGKTLAVDLSLWVCEAQHVHAMAGRVTRPHLRNLFFRVSALTLMGVKLVFVMEGDAPKLKEETMKRRNDSRFRRGGGGGRGGGVKKASVNTSRGRFKAVLRECSELLDYLGVPHLSAVGEAEALCALLDAVGAVDGCITNDGDAFLYGAKTVYRNFNLNSKDPMVECYRSSRLLSELRLSRENLVALGVLLGCDYLPKGVPGVGREQALRLLATLRGESLLERFSQWGSEPLAASDVVLKKVPHCNVCRHPGSVRTHQAAGCRLCNSLRFCTPRDFDQPCPCSAHGNGNALEDNIRRRTLGSPEFPFSEIISEFLVPKDKPQFIFQRRKPNLLLLQRFALEKLDWPKFYTSQKVLVLMTYAEMMNRKTGADSKNQIRPLRILKQRVRNGVACWEVAWRTPEGFVFAEDVPVEEEVKTVEEESLFSLSFPKLVEKYWREREEESKRRTKINESEGKSVKPAAEVLEGEKERGRRREEEVTTPTPEKALTEVEEKKKSKPKRAELPDNSQGISGLLAQMSLQNHPDPPSWDAGGPDSPPVTDCPAVDKQLEEEAAEGSGSPRPVLGVSPSVSVLVRDLHLSDIDWDTASFLATPPPSQDERKKTSGEPRWNSDLQSSAERPLRERLLARSIEAGNVATRNVAARDAADMNVMLNQISEKSVPERFLELKAGLPQGPITENTDKENPRIRTISKAEAAKELETSGEGKDGGKIEGREEKKGAGTAGTSQKPPDTDLFLQSFILCRSWSDPGRSTEGAEPKATQRAKRSVCVSAAVQSSEEEAEEEEDRRHTLHRCNRTRTKARTRTALGSVVSLCDGSISPEPRRPGTHHQNQNRDQESCQRVLAEKVILDPDDDTDDVVNLDNVVSDVIDLEDDPSVDDVIDLDLEDSVFGIASPLPLAERLRLKLLK